MTLWMKAIWINFDHPEMGKTGRFPKVRALEPCMGAPAETRGDGATRRKVPVGHLSLLDSDWTGDFMGFTMVNDG